MDQLEYNLFEALLVENTVGEYSLTGPVEGLGDAKRMYDNIKNGRNPQFTNLSSDELLQHLKGPRNEVEVIDSEMLPDEDAWADQHVAKHHFYIIFDGKVTWWHTPKDRYDVFKNFGGIHTIGSGYGSREETTDILHLPFLYGDVTAEELVAAIDNRKRPKEA